VLLHLRTIFANMAMCKRDIEQWRPDVVILVDYPGFNLDIAKYVHARRKSLGAKVFYYISPKIWAWKEWRIRRIRRDVDELFSILPFEVRFYEQRHGYKIHYVGNPTADEVVAFRERYGQTRDEFCQKWGLDPRRPIIALLAGSRKQEIKDNLPAMLDAAGTLGDYQLVVAGAPAIDDDYYQGFLAGSGVALVKNVTYPLLANSTAALVTSGTATLEAALFDVPQVVCYETPVPRLVRFGFNHVIKVPYISLVNLIVGREVVPELFADRFGVDEIRRELSAILPGKPARRAMLDGYSQLHGMIGTTGAPRKAAEEMVAILRGAR